MPLRGPNYVVKKGKTPVLNVDEARALLDSFPDVAQTTVAEGQFRDSAAAGIETQIGNHTFRATGITAYLKNGGRLEIAQQIANHESQRTTKLYDRRQYEISLDEVERIAV